MATIRVTKAGNDSTGDGSSGAPYLTLLKGYSELNGGDTLEIGTGVYSEVRTTVVSPIPSGTSGNPTIITDIGDGPVTFRRASGWSGLFNFNEVGVAHRFITFQGTAANQLIFDGQGVAGHANIYLGNASNGNGDFTFINCEIKNAGASGVLCGESNRPTFRGCYVHDNGDSTSQDHGIYCGGNLNALIESNVFYNNGANGFRHGGAASSGLILRRNIAYNNGIGGTDGNGFIVYDSAGALVENNLAYGNANGGIHIGRGSGTSVFHNTCHGNRVGILLGGFNNPTNTIIKNNTCVENSADDIEIRSLASGTTYSWNRCSTAGITDNGSSSTNDGNNTTNAVAIQAESGGYSGEWVDPENATLASRDYSLSTGAKSIWDATTNNVPTVGVVEDIEETSRVHPDQGAYAFGTPDPPDPPVIGHNTNYPVTAWTLEDIALTIFDNDGNTKDLALDGSTDGVSIEFGDTTNCTVT